ncbi:MAG: hypothetical protein QOJ51_6666 [Acidobacteriaceae bacterium]|jgi:hypothetical protein|nr:hypothetical protein [Acidobacteriaceae bacterium]MEA2263841.1 hypothetical protein [Acidobacteriaceae bacterium]
MPGQLRSSRPVTVGVLAVVSFVLAILLTTRTVLGRDSDNDNGQIARGAGTTIIHGGTGSPNFVPVITTIAFHAERSGAGVTGELDCLALAPPEPGTGPGSGQFTENAMYVAGKVTGASVHEDTATLTGVADITGLGAGTNVRFTFIVHKGGPGSAAVLTVNSLTFPFHEILVQGAFQVDDQK